MMYKSFDKKKGSRMRSKVGEYVKKVPAENLHKPVIEKFQRWRSLRAVYRKDLGGKLIWNGIIIF